MRIAVAQLLALTLLAAGWGTASAQAPLHTVRGVVRDTADRGLPGVEVILSAPRRSTVTDAAGRFRIDSVPAGDRRLLVRRIGYLAVRPSVKVPMADADTVRVVLLPVPQRLAPIVVESDRPGVRGVVGDTGYHAIPNALVELLGAARADTTDEHGQFGFEGLQQRQYVLRVARPGYYTRFIAVNVEKRGQELSIFLDPTTPRSFDWAATRAGLLAMQDLAHRLAMEPRRNRMTRAELARYGSMPLCEVPRIRLRDPTIILRGAELALGQDLCDWNADEVELVEWGANPCSESWKSIADLLHVWCGARRPVSFGNSTPPAQGGPWIVIWPRG